MKSEEGRVIICCCLLQTRIFEVAEKALKPQHGVFYSEERHNTLRTSRYTIVWVWMAAARGVFAVVAALSLAERGASSPAICGKATSRQRDQN